jgi:hypothetical protein
VLSNGRSAAPVSADSKAADDAAVALAHREGVDPGVADNISQFGLPGDRTCHFQERRRVLLHDKTKVDAKEIEDVDTSAERA